MTGTDLPNTDVKHRTALPECVVFIHGLGRTSKSFALTRRIVKRAGYETISIDYPSGRFRIETLVEQLDLASLFDGRFDKVHFVTHSMGGILLRTWLQGNRPVNLGNTVMLGPPNKGSGIIDTFSRLAVFRWFIGPAGLELSTNANSKPNTLGSVEATIGVVAGTRSYMPFAKRIVGPVCDGKVSVESTKLDEMTDHLCLAVDHTFMMNSPRVMAEVLTFLKTSRFSKSFSTLHALGFILKQTQKSR